MSKIICGDCIKEMQNLPKDSIDSIVTDPPYGLAFMGKEWDDFTPKEYQAFSQKWGKEALRVLKPGAYLLAFSGTRTYHRMVTGLEDAGFTIKDQISWLYGSGFPKSMDISKTIDKHFGKENEREKVGEKPYDINTNVQGGKFSVESENDREGYVKGEITTPATPEAEEWDGWGTALKPAHEPIVLAQKPRQGTYAQNVLKHGVGGLNINESRIKADNRPKRIVHDFRDDVEYDGSSLEGRVDGSLKSSKAVGTTNEGRWPANLIINPQSAMMLDEQSGVLKSGEAGKEEVQSESDWFGGGRLNKSNQIGDSGGASRFFYTAKTHKSERNAGLQQLDEKEYGAMSGHKDKSLKTGSGNERNNKAKNDIATLKPINLIRYLIRLVTPPNGVVLDPFAGSGTTGCAATIEGFNYILIEKRERFANLIAPKRIEYWSNPQNWSDLKTHPELETPTSPQQTKLTEVNK